LYKCAKTKTRMPETLSRNERNSPKGGTTEVCLKGGTRDPKNGNKASKGNRFWPSQQTAEAKRTGVSPGKDVENSASSWQGSVKWRKRGPKPPPRPDNRAHNPATASDQQSLIQTLQIIWVVGLGNWGLFLGETRGGAASKMKKRDGAGGYRFSGFG